MSQTGRKNYMSYWNFTSEEKSQLIARLTKELPALRGAAKATQDEIANAIEDKPTMRQKCKKGK